MYHCRDKIPGKSDLVSEGLFGVIVLGYTVQHGRESMLTGAWTRCSDFIHNQEADEDESLCLAGLSFSFNLKPIGWCHSHLG